MSMNINNIFENICYTELVYERINKKLTTNLSKEEIEKLILKIMAQCRFEWVSEFQFAAGEENHFYKILNISVFSCPPFCKLNF